MDIEKIIEEVTRKVLLELKGNVSLSNSAIGSICASNVKSICNVGSDRCSSCGHCAERRPNDVKALSDIGVERISASPGVSNVNTEIARLIDHTLLSPDTTREDIIKLCTEAKQYNFASVCVNPGFVSLSANLLANSNVKVCTVIGFPLGATSSESKAFETRTAISQGADEIDMVINVGALHAKDYQLIYEDIKGVVCAAGQHLVKVILETSSLNRDEKIIGCVLSKAAGADFVKTSTGFAKGGATIEDVKLMRETVGSEMGVKASGGVRSLEDAKNMVEAGATRIGASASVAIVTGKTGKGSY